MGDYTVTPFLKRWHLSGLTLHFFPAIIDFMKYFLARLWAVLREIPRWLRPGLKIKRWLFLIMSGVTLLGLGIAVVLLDISRTDSNDPLFLTFLSYASLRFLPRLLRALIFGGMGLSAIFYGMYKLNRSLLRPFLRPDSDIFSTLVEYHRRDRGPNLVAIGGGHGFPRCCAG